MRSFVSLLFGSILTCSVYAAPPLDTSVWIVAERPAPVVFAGNKIGVVTYGMGVLTPDREVATAAHVVWGATHITVTDRRGRHSGAGIIRSDASVDAAVLRIEHPLSFVAELRKRPVVAQEVVSMVGRADQGGEPPVITGALASTTWTSHGVPVSLLYPGLKGEKGMSGGGLFDVRGDLVGIIIRIDTTLDYVSVLPIGEFCVRFMRCGK